MIEQELPEGFVYLHTIDSTILESVAYASHENFLGRSAVGYKNPRIILTRPAADALSQVQKALKPHGYGLLVYDGYRPQQTVDAWIVWAQDSADQVGKAHYYPTLTKTEIFRQGYMATKSSHSRGSTVDLSLIPLETALHSPVLSFRTLKNGEEIPYLDDGSLDMGAHFDLFHEISHHDSPLLTPEIIERRNFLRCLMKDHGFREFPTEWWHYTLENEPYPETYFNFLVQ